MINGLVLFAKTGGSTLALEDIVRPVAYHESDTERRERLFRQFMCGNVGTGPVSDSIGDFQHIRITRNTGYDSRIDIIHGSLPTEAEYARIIRRELGEESGNLYEEIYELAKEIQPKFVFLEFKPGKCRSLREDLFWELARLGYDCRWDTLSAYDVGSPQKRERIYLLARKREEASETCSDAVQMDRLQFMERRLDINPGKFRAVERTTERLAEVKAGLDELCVPQYREAFLRLMGVK